MCISYILLQIFLCHNNSQKHHESGFICLFIWLLIYLFILSGCVCVFVCVCVCVFMSGGCWEFWNTMYVEVREQKIPLGISHDFHLIWEGILFATAYDTLTSELPGIFLSLPPILLYECSYYRGILLHHVVIII